MDVKFAVHREFSIEIFSKNNKVFRDILASPFTSSFGLLTRVSNEV
jgi:hypothetical protein